MPRVKAATNRGTKAGKKKPAAESKREVMKESTSRSEKRRRSKRLSENEAVDKQTTPEETMRNGRKRKISERMGQTKPIVPPDQKEQRETTDTSLTRKSKRGGVVDDKPAGSEKKRGRTRDVKVTDTAMTKWTPISQPAKDLLSNAMTAALGHCMEEMRGGRRRHSAEMAIQQVMHKVSGEVERTRAPNPNKKLQHYGSELKAKIDDLKDKCVAIVSKNEEMDQTMEERKLFCEEKTKAMDELEGVKVHSKQPKTSRTTTLSQMYNEEEFADHITTLLSHTTDTVHLTTTSSSSSLPTTIT